MIKCTYILLLVQFFLIYTACGVRLSPRTTVNAVIKEQTQTSTNVTTSAQTINTGFSTEILENLFAVVNDDYAYNYQEWSSFLSAHSTMEQVQLFSRYFQRQNLNQDRLKTATEAYEAMITVVPWSARLISEMKMLYQSPSDLSDYLDILTTEHKYSAPDPSAAYYSSGSIVYNSREVSLALLYDQYYHADDWLAFLNKHQNVSAVSVFTNLYPRTTLNIVQETQLLAAYSEIITLVPWNQRVLEVASAVHENRTDATSIMASIETADTTSYLGETSTTLSYTTSDNAALAQVKGYTLLGLLTYLVISLVL
ncbi:hypothetical protein CANARDRAFT_28898 [[Candida] arabinofermentans NRRL YB-2248]|uniref:Uncharacterized protein n=1 Tax=[Candida] arabinofermentans NRRL YB-2248 TaxID=983967 RepID=A0A1E4SZ30_9ASCO|nr:hypothetical protein CANARDRAFT_28898 [[Candida] arabinofermentans NRRL YB-2248]